MNRSTQMRGPLGGSYANIKLLAHFHLLDELTYSRSGPVELQGKQMPPVVARDGKVDPGFQKKKKIVW